MGRLAASTREELENAAPTLPFASPNPGLGLGPRPTAVAGARPAGLGKEVAGGSRGRRQSWRR